MLIFRYFTGCISHPSLVIIFDKISVFINSDGATRRSSINSYSKSVLNEFFSIIILITQFHAKTIKQKILQSPGTIVYFQYQEKPKYSDTNNKTKLQ